MKATCMICLMEGPLISRESLEKVRYSDLKVFLNSDSLLPNDHCVLTACKVTDHATCASCVRSMYAGNDVYEPVLKGFVEGKLCPQCPTVTHLKEKWLHHLLTPLEYRLFSKRLRRVMHPSSIFIPCQNMTPIRIPLSSNNPLTPCSNEIVEWVECPFDIEVPKERWGNHRKGDLVIECTSTFCLHRRCADCKWPVAKSSPVCERCWDEESLSVNSLLWSKVHKRGLYSSEISMTTVLAHLCDILGDDEGHVTCPGCGVKIIKTVDCNSICHCGYHFCYVCRSVTSEPFLPLSHWDPEGKLGCPRWDSDPYWSIVAQTNFKCDDQCRSHDVPCTRKDHHSGKKAMTLERKRWAIWHLLRSLDDSLFKSLHLIDVLPPHPHFVDLENLRFSIEKIIQSRSMTVNI